MKILKGNLTVLKNGVMLFIQLDTNEFIAAEFIHPDTNIPHLLLYADDFIITPTDSVKLLSEIPFKYGSHIIGFNNKKYAEWEVIK